MALWLAGCQGAAHQGDAPVAEVDGQRLDQSVVEMIAKRDGVSESQARAQAIETLQLVAMARQRANDTAGEPKPLVSQQRRKQLSRAALARLWLKTDFEPKRQPNDIARNHPVLVNARESRRHIHPKIHWLCQLVAVPSAEDPQQRADLARDPAWIDQAHQRFDPIARRMRDDLPRNNETCDLMQTRMQLETAQADLVTVRVEAQGFVLDACAQQAPDGTCQERQWDATWVEHVEQAQGPGFLPPFTTPFGLHQVYVLEIAAARDLEDPGTDEYLRAAVHEAWRREAFQSYLGRLRERRVVRLAAGAPQ